MVAADESRPGPSRVRLAKYLAHAGVASRRAAEGMIARRARERGGRDRAPTRHATSTSAAAWRSTASRSRGPSRACVYALNKPVGVVSTARDTHGRKTVVELVPARGLRLYPVGRLDVDSTGLILLTNDGELANRLTHPRFEVPKTYRARLAGAPVGDGCAAGAARRRASSRTGQRRRRACGAVGPARIELIELTIHEGRNRQVRRMCEAVGHRVLELERTGFGPLDAGGLAPGAHRRVRTRSSSACARSPLRRRRASVPPRWTL